MSTEGKCPVCEFEPVTFQALRMKAVECPRCGLFEISSNLIQDFATIRSTKPEYDLRLLKYLCAGIRLATKATSTIPKLTTQTWRDYASGVAATSISTKTRRLLDLIGARSWTPGSVVKLDANLDYPLIGASGVEEYWFLFIFIRDRQYIRESGSQHEVKLEPKGWEEIEPSGGGISGRCFVAMSFDPAYEEAFLKGIEPALRDDCKLDPIRIDKQHHNEKICDLILAEIRRCEFLVADFSLHRPGVYFEAGFALGLGKEVIWLCQKDEFTKEKTHFDTRQYNHIVWTAPDDLRSQLKDRVQARRAPARG
jgi:hypothetical protein